jgi:predicted metalloprotease
MRWQGRRKSDNVDDRRGGRVARRGLQLGGGGIIIIVVFGLLTGQSPLEILGLVGNNLSGGGQQVQAGTSEELSAEEQRMGEFVSAVLANTEDIWNEVYPEQTGNPYREPTLVLFSQRVSSACGMQSSAVGPFYCPGDNQVYLDTSFFTELSRRFDAPGDFAQAYVVAHEVGHHIQNLTGASTRVHHAQQRAGETESNELSVMLELQADCYAGVWAHYAKNDYDMLERGDLEEGLRAANAIGDDNIQKQSRGYVVPDSFTHGTGDQRERWFVRGFESGRMDQCDTFEASSL